MSNKSTLLEPPAPPGNTADGAAMQWFADLKVPPAVQTRLEDFAERNTEGQLSSDELEEYKLMVELSDYLSLAKVKAIRFLESHSGI